jgi:hypothetical protein
MGSAFRLGLAAAQDAVHAAVAAELPGDVPCDLGWPDGGPQELHVWVDAGFESEITSYLSGGRLRDESGIVKVRVLVSAKDMRAAAMRDAALELAGNVEDAIADDPTLGGLVQHARVAKVEGEYGLTEGRRQYGLTVSVAYELAASGPSG